jgi:hypothetical protein
MRLRQKSWYNWINLCEGPKADFNHV